MAETDYNRQEMKPRILIADDEQKCRKQVMDRLNQYDFDQVCTADEEIELARRAYESGSPYHAIITDNRMNDGREFGGIYAIGKIREFDLDTKIIMLSSDVAMEVMIQALNVGATDYIVKGNEAMDDLEKCLTSQG